MALVAGTLGLMCRSFISIIVPLLENGHNLWNSPKCRSFISIIVPKTQQDVFEYIKKVSILYKDHSSQKSQYEQIRGYFKVSILYKYHSSQGHEPLIVQIKLRCRSFISIIVPTNENIKALALVDGVDPL